MRRWVTLVAMLGCGGAETSPVKGPTSELARGGAAQLIEATARGDVAATRAMLHESVGYGGLWFEDTKCRIQLAGAGTIQGAGLDALARCLATLRLARSERSSPYPDIEVLTYEPGIEIEVLFGAERGSPKVRWIGYVSRRTARDALPTITQRALEAHRLEGSVELDEATRSQLASERAAGERQFDATWLKVCVDAGGAVTRVDARETTSVALQNALSAAIGRWRFQPVVLGGQPTPVCALMWHDYPAGAANAKTPLQLPSPVPAGYESAIIVGPTALKRVAGSSMIVPDDDAKIWFQKRGGGRVVGSFFSCITPQGTVDVVITERPTEVPRYDEQIRAAIHSWRFAPLLIDGQAAAACTHMIFIYSQH